MKKSDFIDSLSNNLNNYSEIDISISADLIQKAIIDSLKKRHRIEIRGFGTFCIRDRKSIRARNPKSGEPVFVPSKIVPFFRVGKELKKRVDN